MSKCNCFPEMLEKLRQKIDERIPEGSADVSVDWQNRSFIFSGDYAPVNPKIEIEYRRPKNGGGHAKNFTRDSVSVLCNYCPFCGRELGKSKDTADNG